MLSDLSFLRCGLVTVTGHSLGNAWQYRQQPILRSTGLCCRVRKHQRPVRVTAKLPCRKESLDGIPHRNAGQADNLRRLALEYRGPS
jgi:hypothetical protein